MDELLLKVKEDEDTSDPLSLTNQDVRCIFVDLLVSGTCDVWTRKFDSNITSNSLIRSIVCDLSKQVHKRDVAPSYTNDQTKCLIGSDRWSTLDQRV